MRGAARAEVKAVADARDATLKELQQKNRDRKDKEIDLDPTGQIRGILCRMKREKRAHLHRYFRSALCPVYGVKSLTLRYRLQAWA